jgi:multicomponent K+:H+ antiporter subunit E
MTPGTLSCAIAPDGRALVVHALHLDDAEALVAQIKERYEKPLKEIFE